MRTHYKLKFGLPNYPLTQSSLIEGKMMNCYFFRRVTSSILASLFALTVGIGSVKSVRAEDTKRLTFCRENRTLFHLDKGAEKKVTVAVLDFENSSYQLVQGRQTSVIQTTGLGSVLESKLLEEGKLDVFKLDSSYNPNPTSRYPNPTPPPESLVSNKLLQQLRYIRDKNDVEAVIIVTVMQFQTTEEVQSGWLITKNSNNEEIDIKLNLQVVDTTTGKIILEAQGHGSESANTLTKVNLPFEVSIHRKTEGKYDSENKKWNRSSGEYFIEFKLGSNATPTPVYERSSTITEKLIAKATEQGMEEIKTKLNKRIESEELPCLLRKPTLVAWVNKDETQVILNKGKSHGYCKGMTFSIERYLEVVTDPATGRVISMETEKVGEVTLISVDAESSVGELKQKDAESNTKKSSAENGKSFQRKDIARLTSDVNCQDEGQNNLPGNSGITNPSQYLQTQPQQGSINPQQNF